ncbi:hypothetical protein BDN67DRAFT_986251, partial [Paxillus ammoniavirescens]
MPQEKTTCGRLKTISCPWCSKKLYTETNVLQHLNQPTGLCYGTSLLEATDLMSGTDTAAEAAPSHEMDQPCSPEKDWDPGLARGDDDSDVDMAPPDAPDHPPFLEAQPEQLSQGRFIEMFTGCAESFPSGKTFMDVFGEDQYAEQRRENLYFPWALKE